MLCVKFSTITIILEAVFPNLGLARTELVYARSRLSRGKRTSCAKERERENPTRGALSLFTDFCTRHFCLVPTHRFALIPIIIALCLLRFLRDLPASVENFVGVSGSVVCLSPCGRPRNARSVLCGTFATLSILPRSERPDTALEREREREPFAKGRSLERERERLATEC